MLYLSLWLQNYEILILPIAPFKYIYTMRYFAFHVLVPTNFWRYYFYILPDQAQILLDYFNVLDELWGEISFKSDNG